MFAADFFYYYAPEGCLNLKGSGRFAVASAESLGGGDSGPGERAFSHGPTYTDAFFTLLPPNSPSCAASSGNAYGGVSASSNHSGGVNVVFADGAVRFIPDTISVKNMKVSVVGEGGTHVGTPENHDAWIPQTPLAGNANGDVAAGEPFSYGVWAQLGAINDGAAVSL